MPVALPSSPALMAEIFNTINLGLIVVDESQRVILWNSWVEKHSDISTAQALGKLLSAAFAEAPSPAFANAVASTLKYGLPVMLSNALHRSPLPFYPRDEELHDKKRLHQSITLTPLTLDSQRCCLIQITDASTSIKREKILRSHSEILKKEATTDSLTGIYNRRFFDEHFKMALATGIRSNTPLSIFMVDIDFFKEYNDHYGHVEGDKALVAVASALKAQLQRASDVAARFGGEEFILLLPNMSQLMAEQFAEKLRLAIWDLSIPHAMSRIVQRLSISVGFSTYTKAEAKDPHTLLRTADAALYEAKRNGRNRCYYLPLPEHKLDKPAPLT